MVLLVGDRGSGKSDTVIKKAHETGAYIITFNHDEVIRLSQRAEELGLNIRYPITIDEYLNHGMMGSWVRNVIIDNADEVLRRVFRGFHVEMMTMTKEESFVEIS